MKKILVFVFALFFSATLFAQEAQETKSSRKRNDAKWSSVTYVNIPISRIYQTSKAYVVVYQKNKTGLGSTTIPKEWVNGSSENPSKLKFRSVKGALQPFMTVIKKEGSFLRVVLSTPPDTNVDFWRLGDDNAVSDTDKETLEELEL